MDLSPSIASRETRPRRLLWTSAYMSIFMLWLWETHPRCIKNFHSGTSTDIST